MAKQKYDYGMIGLGTMGRNLVFNINNQGFSVAGFDKDMSQVELLTKEAEYRTISANHQLNEFVNSLKLPRVIMLMVPAGEIVDEVIHELLPLLAKNDLLIDCGNSHFTDTNARYDQLAKSAIHFMGVGISGGESGARHGPSIMPGGSKGDYERIAPMLKSISAKVQEEPCVTWLGPGSAGHYVKMVHNGIEYGLMQLISEAYHLLKKAGGKNNDELHAIFSKWNEGILQSYLLEITADIFIQKDELTSNRLIDMILDRAHQNGTGGWTSQDAMCLQVPIPVIDCAVSVRDLSANKDTRRAVQQQLNDPKLKMHAPEFKLNAPESKFSVKTNELTQQLEQALYFSMIITYAQGMALLYAASKNYKYDLKLERIAGIWRGGCIIRSGLLDDIRSAFSNQQDMANLLMDNELSKKLITAQNGMRKVIQSGVEAGIPIPAMMNSLAYFDSYRCGWLPANLVQAQRDYFGAHTYERTDEDGKFHTHWSQRKT